MALDEDQVTAVTSHVCPVSRVQLGQSQVYLGSTQIIEHCIMLCYLGVPVTEKTYMYGDNKSVVGSSSVPQSKLHKQHTALSYQQVQEAIAAGIVSFTHLPGSMNPADILSKHWAYSSIWPMLQALLFFPGDTLSLIEDDL